MTTSPRPGDLPVSRQPDLAWRSRFGVHLLLTLLTCSAFCGEVAVPAVATSRLDAELKGHVLIEELNWH